MPDDSRPELLNYEKLHEHVTDQFQSISNSLIVLARQAAESPVNTTHQTRKTLKRLRAITKLLRKAKTEESYKSANQFLRDHGRQFSGLRDAHVRSFQMDGLLDDNLFQSFSELLSELDDENSRIIDQLESDLIFRENRFQEMANSIAANQQLFHYFNEVTEDPDMIAESYRECYQTSRDAFFSGVILHEAETLHEWRKRLKDLQYQSELLAGIRSPYTFSFYPDLEQLCDTLGEINDLFMLTAWIHDTQQSFKNRDDLHALMSVLNQQKKPLLRKAERGGNQFYEEYETLFVTSSFIQTESL